MQNHFPVVISENIRIVNFELHHLTDNYVSWLNDKKVVRYSEQRHKTHSIGTCKEYFEKIKGSDDYFCAIEIITGSGFKHVGNIGVSVDIQNKVADLSILIGDRTVWGTGVGSKAWVLVIHTLIQNLGFRLITAGTMSVNLSMLKLIKKSGMTISGVVKGRFIWEGEEVDLILASIQAIQNV